MVYYDIIMAGGLKCEEVVYIRVTEWIDAKRNSREGWHFSTSCK
jgi:hypothetical protein